MKTIKLLGKWGEGREAIVSDEDYERLVKYKWYGNRDHTRKDKRIVVYPIRPDEGKIIYMHMDIIGKIKGLVADHINRNTLDNRRENLRHLTPSESNKNRRVYRKSPISGKIGLGYTKVGNKYQAQCGILGKNKYLGIYDTAKEAIETHENYRKLLLENK